MVDKKSQGIIRDERGQEQPADNKRAQHVTSVEEKKKTEDEIQKDRWEKRVLEHVRRLSSFPRPRCGNRSQGESIAARPNQAQAAGLSFAGKETAFRPNLHHLNDFRTARRLERPLEPVSRLRIPESLPARRPAAYPEPIRRPADEPRERIPVCVLQGSSRNNDFANRRFR